MLKPQKTCFSRVIGYGLGMKCTLMSTRTSSSLTVSRCVQFLLPRSICAFPNFSVPRSRHYPIKELIKVKGFQVAPAELEGWILNHADVRDCGVIGLPDESAGEVPCAFVALSADAARRCQDTGSQDEQNKAVDAIKKSIMKHVADHKVR